ncbi:MAG: hypothetical protein HY586_00235 [Candidatus Omnitrophica bacterium]|nr:hypothetical protein [Candidatus Omnitrophota bacterium]
MSRIINDNHHCHEHHDESRDVMPILKMEILGHLPFTVAGLVFGLVVVALGSGWMRVILSEGAFHFTHFIHIFLSAAAAAALMTFYESSYARSVIVGMLSSVVLCSISDTVIPYWGALWMGKEPVFHLCLAEHPLWVALVALAGTNVGLVWLRGFEHCSKWNHLLHISVSAAASGIYLFSFSHSFLAHEVIGVLVILFISIFIPCLVSDVVVPLLAVHPSFFLKRLFGSAKGKA